VQELTRGPIHEAFGQPTVFNPVASPVVPKRPPELIDEVPPDEKPEGDNIAWIPGYWGWEDDTKNFVWVSGFWRRIPPGRGWVPGYWNATDGGYQWVSGYWAPADMTDAVYLPPPPESREVGPTNEVADENQIWIPGVWVWRETHYWWRPGFFATANPDWVWVPAHYVWTPSGYLFVEGYWDYPMFDRGLLFTPVVFTSVPAAGLVYTPSVVIDLRFLAGALFVRPAWNHYYFGDYYDPSYMRAGIYPWFAFHNSRFGFDPLFAQTSYVYGRRDPQWLPRVRETFLTRRENPLARPPHTIREFNDWLHKIDPSGTRADSVAYVKPLADVMRTRDFPVRLTRLDERRKATIRAQSQAIQKFRSERIRVEQEVARDLPRGGAKTEAGGTRPAVRSTPARVKMPEAPRLIQTPPGVGGKTAPPAGVGAGSRGGTLAPPEAPRVPDLAPPGSAPPTAPREGLHPLPLPEENLRPPAGTAVPKGRVGEPAPTPLPKASPPGRPEPPKKDGKDKE
jgi:hypothetical protein